MIIEMAEYSRAVPKDNADHSRSPRGHKDSTTVSDATVAWLLLEHAQPCLTEDQRTLVFIELDCGEHHLAIARMLKVAADKRFPLCAEVLTTVATWLTPYVGSLEERRLRPLLDALECG
jgi:hypothetical protein